MRKGSKIHPKKTYYVQDGADRWIGLKGGRYIHSMSNSIVSFGAINCHVNDLRKKKPAKK